MTAAVTYELNTWAGIDAAVTYKRKNNDKSSMTACSRKYGRKGCDKCTKHANNQTTHNEHGWIHSGKTKMEQKTTSSSTNHDKRVTAQKRHVEKGVQHANQKETTTEAWLQRTTVKATKSAWMEQNDNKLTNNDSTGKSEVNQATEQKTISAIVDWARQSRTMKEQLMQVNNRQQTLNNN